jgi:uncharacterized protein YraI
MRTSVLALVTAAAMLSAVSLRAAIAEADTIRLAQVDVDVRMGPSRSPDVVIEEPRPPSAAIETEGRRERQNCHSVTITEWQDGVRVTRTEQQCDR